MKLIAASLALSFGLFLASSQAFASCPCKSPPPPPPPHCGCHQHHYHPVPVTPPPLPPAPPFVERFHGPCGNCNRDGARNGERCWQIPITDDRGQILYFRRKCE